MESSGVSYILVLEDITTIAKAQRQIAWGEIARRLAHEIKNPLTPIQLSAERLHNKIKDKLNVNDRNLLNKSTNTIIKQVDALNFMVNEFSEYARSPKIVKKQSILLSLLMKFLIYILIKIFKLLKNIQKNKTLKVDENKLRQVFINIFDNSKSLFKILINQKINIAIKFEKKSIRIKFEDNGIGIPKEIIEKIFEPYVTSKKNGTGLGLAIVYKIIEEHNGVIEINNKKPTGVSILITLPTEESEIG